MTAYDWFFFCPQWVHSNKLSKNTLLVAQKSESPPPLVILYWKSANIYFFSLIGKTQNSLNYYFVFLSIFIHHVILKQHLVWTHFFIFLFLFFWLFYTPVDAWDWDQIGSFLLSFRHILTIPSRCTQSCLCEQFYTQTVFKKYCKFLETWLLQIGLLLLFYYRMQNMKKIWANLCYIVCF